MRLDNDHLEVNVDKNLTAVIRIYLYGFTLQPLAIFDSIFQFSRLFSLLY